MIKKVTYDRIKPKFVIMMNRFKYRLKGSTIFKSVGVVTQRNEHKVSLSILYEFQEVKAFSVSHNQRTIQREVLT